MRDFVFNTTASIRLMAGGAARIASLVADLPGMAGILGRPVRLLFVTDPGIMQLDLGGPALADLRREGIEVTLFDRCEPDPSAVTVTKAARIGREALVDGVIGFGGGSSMDVAKVVALLCGNDQPLDTLYGVGLARGRRLPLLLVPTTAGTGSEVTPISILTTETAEKKGISSATLLPDIALLDCDLTMGLPPAVTAATGVDAMVHAIEAYSSRNPNNNPVSRMIAVQALGLLAGSIRTAVFQGSDRGARANMLLGSMLAGQAFANSPVAGVHALAYPVGARFHVPHGLSNALVLAEVMRFNAAEAEADYAALAPQIFPEIDRRQPEPDIVAELVERLIALNAALGLAPGLRSVGIGLGDVPGLARDAMRQTRLLVNNPREIREDDARRIYTAAL